MKSLRNLLTLLVGLCMCLGLGCTLLGSKYHPHKDSITNEQLNDGKIRFVGWIHNSFANERNQVILYNMLNQATNDDKLLDVNKGRYMLIFRVKEYNKVEQLQRFNMGSFAGVDHILTEIFLIDLSLIKDKDYSLKLSEISEKRKYLEPEHLDITIVKQMSDASETLTTFQYANVFQGSVETNHQTPNWLYDDAFMARHAKDIISFLTKE